MRQVGDGVYALGSRGHNFYVLRDGDEVTVIDAGCSREWRKLARGLASIGLSIDAVAGIVVTHAHADHIGFGKKAAGEGVPVSVHDDDEPRALGTYTGRYAVSPSELPIFRFRARDSRTVIRRLTLTRNPITFSRGSSINCGSGSTPGISGTLAARMPS